MRFSGIKKSRILSCKNRKVTETLYHEAKYIRDMISQEVARLQRKFPGKEFQVALLYEKPMSHLPFGSADPILLYSILDTYDDSQIPDIEHPDSDTYDVFWIYISEPKAITGGCNPKSDNRLNNCLYNYLKMGYRTKWKLSQAIKTSELLKERLHLSRQDPISIQLIPEVKTASSICINVTGDHYYQSNKKHKRSISLVLANGHYSLIRNPERQLTNWMESLDKFKEYLYKSPNYAYIELFERCSQAIPANEPLDPQEAYWISDTMREILLSDQERIFRAEVEYKEDMTNVFSYSKKNKYTQYDLNNAKALGLKYSLIQDGFPNALCEGGSAGQIAKRIINIIWEALCQRSYTYEKESKNFSIPEGTVVKKYQPTGYRKVLFKLSYSDQLFKEENPEDSPLIACQKDAPKTLGALKYEKEDSVSEDGVSKDNVSGDNVSKDNVSGDNVSEDNVSKDNISEDDEAGAGWEIEDDYYLIPSWRSAEIHARALAEVIIPEQQERPDQLFPLEEGEYCEQCIDQVTTN
ncbi:hypothetical protein C1645_835484 [Glomus cerebriforme]|uniref:Uncharacterized protein n=1 Tax=Glomus cerebriforme TaxID=658196 RepID=A0A397SA61_9GLOM|nr:hypothetical protein C1645_835484 [Glomus cerebriforme]